MHQLTAKELHESFISGERSALEIIEYFLHRIETVDPEIASFLNVLNERAIQKAKDLDAKLAAGKPLGRLAGVPIAVKDNMHIDGEITTCASKFLENYRAVFDSTVVKLIEADDGIIIGKTNLDEFAMGSSTEHSAYKMTRNPWNTDYVPGGSSGGSAAAVAACLCPVALGSDTGGSTRQPAALCGVYGFKPTYGNVSRFGLVAFGSSLDQIGPLTRNMGDMGMILEVIDQHCPKDSTSLDVKRKPYLSEYNKDIKGMTIGVPFKFIESLKGEGIRRTFDNNLETLKSLGAKIIDIDLDILKYSNAVYYVLATAEASTNLARFDGIRYGKRSEKAETLNEIYDFSKEEGFGAEVKRRILLGTFVLSAGYQDAYYRKAQKVRTMMIEKYKEVFETCDIIAMPTTPSPAFRIGEVLDPLEMYLSDIYTISANLTGIPAISIPAGMSTGGLPLGLQLQAPQLEDTKLCRVADAFESVTEFHKMTPKLAEGVAS